MVAAGDGQMTGGGGEGWGGEHLADEPGIRGRASAQLHPQQLDADASVQTWAHISNSRFAENEF